jgi:KaiC/GvpD/RAD55 family RecA-like ATPase
VSKAKLALVREPGLEPEQVDAESANDFDDENAAQVERARELLYLPSSAFLRWPWEALDRMAGGLGPGAMAYVCARTGSGKSTLITSAIDQWMAEGRKIFHMPLETEPGEWRLRWACHRVGFDAGDVLSGVAQQRPDWPEWRDRIDAERESQRSDELKQRGLWVDPVPEVNAKNLVEAIQLAADSACDVIIVDHIDQLEAEEGSSLFNESVRANKWAKKVAKKTGMRIVMTSQLNRLPPSADRMTRYLPPQERDVYMGEHKGHVATLMLGLFRPLRERRQDEPVPMKGSGMEDRYVEALRAARSGAVETWTMLKENTMGVVSMKNRNSGKDRHEGQRCELGVEQGRVVEIPERDRYRNGRA